MSTNPTTNGAPINFEAIQSIVKQGKTVISAEDSTVVELALKAIEEGKTATFYLKNSQFSEIVNRRFRTSEKAKARVSEMHPISKEEAARIKTDFGIEIDGYSSQETCPRCGSIYGTYQFIQQGIKEHGEHAVRAVFSLEGVSVLQVHPRQSVVCQTCHLIIIVIAPHSYLYRDWNHSYGCSE